MEIQFIFSIIEKLNPANNSQNHHLLVTVPRYPDHGIDVGTKRPMDQKLQNATSCRSRAGVMMSENVGQHREQADTEICKRGQNHVKLRTKFTLDVLVNDAFFGYFNIYVRFFIITRILILEFFLTNACKESRRHRETSYIDTFGTKESPLSNMYDKSNQIKAFQCFNPDVCYIRSFIQPCLYS